MATIFELTAREVAEMDEELIHEYMNRHEFRLASMNSKTREAMFEAIIAECEIEGGWFWLGESAPVGPFKSHNEALSDIREVATFCGEFKVDVKA